jgi:hypothetical protein
MSNTDFRIKVSNAIICDDIRREVSEKLILIGVYSGSIAIHNFPATLALSLYCEIMAEYEGSREVSLRAVVGKLPVSQMKFIAEGTPPGQSATLILPPLPITFSGETKLKFQISTDEKKWITLIEKGVIKGGPFPGVASALPPPS